MDIAFSDHLKDLIKRCTVIGKDKPSILLMLEQDFKTFLMNNGKTEEEADEIIASLPEKE